MKLHRAQSNYCPKTAPDGLVDVSAEPYEANGRVFLPACEIASGTALRDDDQAMMVQLEMSAGTPIGNTLGMFVRFTPDGARLFAQKLIDNAQKVEAHVAKQASAAIEKARKQ